MSDPRKGIESLRVAVYRDCEKAGGTLHEDGCVKCGAKCFHRYCDKFKWVLDRAAHYAEKLGLDRDALLSSWEEDRSYWYMNYYQDCEQPKIESERIRVFNTVEELLASVGDAGFRCPACGGVTKSPYECKGNTKADGKVCDWKVYGLLRGLGKDVFVFCKDKLKGERMFMPVAWEGENK